MTDKVNEMEIKLSDKKAADKALEKVEQNMPKEEGANVAEKVKSAEQVEKSSGLFDTRRTGFSGRSGFSDRENVEQKGFAGAYSTDHRKPRGKKPDFKKENKGRRDDRRREDSEFDKVLVGVRRVTKVVKGGRTMRFSATVAVGDKKGKVGIGIGKAAEVPLAIDKAAAMGRKSLKEINLLNGTIHHETIGKFGATSILMFPAKPGTGIIAGGSARAVLELAGITDIVTKVHGSTNKINVVKATLKGLMSIKTKEQVAETRSKAVEEI